jgi:hypothetical protein
MAFLLLLLLPWIIDRFKDEDDDDDKQMQRVRCNVFTAKNANDNETGLTDGQAQLTLIAKVEFGCLCYEPWH